MNIRNFLLYELRSARVPTHSVSHLAPLHLRRHRPRALRIRVAKIKVEKSKWKMTD